MTDEEAQTLARAAAKIEQLEAALARANERSDRLHAALHYYAKRGRYEFEVLGRPPAILVDAGSCARAALEPE